MNKYHIILKEVLLGFGVHDPRHVDMLRTNIKIRERKKKKNRETGLDYNIIFKRGIQLFVSYLDEEKKLK